MTGVTTNVCVESTLREGFMLGYDIVLVEDCCHSTSRTLHDATAANVRASFGEVVTAADLAAIWRKDRQGADRMLAPSRMTR
jgi:ureidoacrylate peracid hydrolase